MSWAVIRFFTMTLLITPLALSGCAIFSGGDDEPVKNENVHASPPQSPFEEVKVSSADHVWQSRKTGNTIAYNSACQEKLKADLGTLEKGILKGVDNLKILNETRLTVDGAPAERTRVEGKTEGIPISVDLVVIKKGNCTYDLAYVARTISFSAEQSTFQQFIERFHTP